jgi:hypothetical protein
MACYAAETPSLRSPPRKQGRESQTEDSEQVALGSRFRGNERMGVCGSIFSPGAENRREQGMRVQSFDMSQHLDTPAAQKGANSAGFLKFPAQFPGVHPCGETRKMGTVGPASRFAGGERGV